MPAARRAIGGLLLGFGTGIVEHNQRLREDALERARAMREDQRRAEDRAFQTERDRRQNAAVTARDIRQSIERREESRGLLQSTHVAEGGEVKGVTRAGEVRDLGFRAARTSGADTSGLPAGDQRLIDQAVERFTTAGDGLSGVDQVDWTSAADRLTELGRPDLARLIAPSERERLEIDTNSEQYQEARQRADEWVSSQAGMFSSDKSDFERFGGNREQARQAKTLEFYQQLTGAGAQSGQSPGREARPAASSAPSGQLPRGAGTRESPYEPATQAEYDAIPSGAIYRRDDGQLYTKG